MTTARLRTSVRVEDEAWRGGLGDAANVCRRAAVAGWTLGRRDLPQDHDLASPLSAPVEISILLSNDDEVRALNKVHRRKDRPTNVLSFPGDTSAGAIGQDVLLGDIVLAWETVAKEAENEHKPVSDHTSHLVIHGVLHLLGYDHEQDDDATHMERLEVDSLARLGVPDPYKAGG